MHFKYVGPKGADNPPILTTPDGEIVPPRTLDDEQSKHFAQTIRKHIKHAVTPLFEEVPDKPADPAKE